MRYFSKTFTLRLIEFLSQKTGYKKSKVNSYAFFLENLFEKIACINSNDATRMQNHFMKYIKLQKHGRYSDMGTRLTHSDISELIMYNIEDRGTIAKMIEELTLMGYISRSITGQNVNSKGIAKRDASYKYKINLRKLIRDMDRTVLTRLVKIKGSKEKKIKEYKCLYAPHKVKYYGVECKLKETFCNQIKQKR